MAMVAPLPPPRPAAPQLAHIPHALRDRPQWVLWTYAWRNDKWTKVPRTARGGAASSTDPTTWGTLPDVWAAYEGGEGDGIGFVFSTDDPFVGVDLDDCIEPGGTLKAWAAAVLRVLPSYTEITPSGTGVHIICTGTIPGPRRRKGDLEMYSEGRFFTVTGQHWPTSPKGVADGTPGLTALYTEYFPDPVAAPRVVSGIAPVLSDAQVLQRARAAKNGTKFAALYDRGDTSEYTSASEADLALCSLLAFYTQDPLQIERLMEGSSLGQRAKWQQRPVYRTDTINKALAGERERFGSRPALVPTPSGDPPTPPTTHPGEARTELGNAERLVAAHGADLRYTKGLGWLCWDSRRWVRDETGEVMRRAKATVRALYEESWALPPEAGTALRKHAVISESAKALKAMVSLAESERAIGVTTEAFDTHPWLLNCLNGTMDLRTAAIAPHDRTHLLTKLAPVTFDASAECPTWLVFLDRIFGGDLETIEYVQRAVGYALTGSIREQCMFMLYGTGANGKSTFLQTLQAVLGDYAQSTPATTLLVRPDGAATNDLARLAGARFVAAVESEEGKRLAEALIKQMTGGDKIVARYLRQEFFEFVPVFKLFFATNHKPVIRGTDMAIWRRIHLIPFTVTIPAEERDAGLTEKLIAEGPGILTWAIEGALYWQAQGLAPPKSVTSATEDYRSEMDILSAFLAESCIEGRGKEVTHKALYAAYSAWAEESGERPISSRAFSLRLTERGRYHSGRASGNVLTWYGLGLVQP